MPLEAEDLQHAIQIQAGIDGRNQGHQFELELTELINDVSCPFNRYDLNINVFRGEPTSILINKALTLLDWDFCDNVTAIELGSIATAEGGKEWLKVNGIEVRACKSDILLTLTKNEETKTIGISVKQCNKKNPTNAQLFFTTAQAFSNLLIQNGIPVSQVAINALKQFCGENGFKPSEDQEIMKSRLTDPRRFFWEEINHEGKEELENIFQTKQNEITKLLLQKAYLNDPFLPELLIHKTKKIDVGSQEYAIYTMEELIDLSKQYNEFYTKDYSVKKGSYKDPEDITHKAPRFGIVQMQRGGQQQHPTQLQFNLEAGYFYKI